MSANIYWEPTTRKRHSVGTSAPSSFISALERATEMSMPIVLDRSHVDLLRGLAAGAKDPAFLELADAVQSNDSIEVTAQY